MLIIDSVHKKVSTLDNLKHEEQIFSSCALITILL
jgi:hypothetical protein